MAITTTISDKAGARSVTMNSAKRLLTVLGSSKHWLVESTTFTQTVDSPAYTFDMESGDPPMGWTAGANASLSAEADEHTGGSGSKSLKITSIAAGANAYATRDIDARALPENYYLFNAWAKNIDSTYGCYMNTGSFVIPSPAGEAPYYNDTSWGKIETIYRMGGGYTAVRVQIHSGGANQSGLWDYLTFSKINTNTQIEMSNANMQVDFEYDLPTTPFGYQQLWFMYRKSSENELNYFAVKLKRSLLNAAWDIVLDKVVNGTITNLITVTGIGDTNAIRIKVVGDVHRLSTRTGTTWMQRGIDKTDAFNNTAKGVNTIYDPDFTPTAIRGSQPLPF